MYSEPGRVLGLRSGVKTAVDRVELVDAGDVEVGLGDPDHFEEQVWVIGGKVAPGERIARARVVGSQSRIEIPPKGIPLGCQVESAKAEADNRPVEIGLGVGRRPSELAGDHLPGRRHDLHQPASRGGGYGEAVEKALLTYDREEEIGRASCRERV